MKRNKHILLGLILASLALPAGTAMAANTPVDVPFSTRTDELPRRNLYAQRKSERRISASQAKSAAMSRYRGARFINVQLVGGDTYRVRLQQKNGRIVDVYVDARTGRVKN